MLHSHDDFLRAIDAQLGERTARLVYADWLDEQSDPHGELIRVEEEMRQLPVYSDRFWELKPRRNELRSLFGPEWCARMRYGTDYEPLFRNGFPEGWRERWRLLREFFERRLGVSMPDVGGRKREIAETEQRLGRTLPRSIREWIAFAHDARSVEDCPDGLRDLVEFRDMPSWSAIAPFFRSAGSSDPPTWSWQVILQSDLANPDPPVYSIQERITDDNRLVLVRDDRPLAIQAVSVFAFRELPFIVRESGGFSVTTDQRDELNQELADALGPSVRIGHMEVYESENLIAWLIPLPSSSALLEVEASGAARRDCIPPFLLDLANRGHGHRPGVFLPEGEEEFVPPPFDAPWA